LAKDWNDSFEIKKREQAFHDERYKQIIDPRMKVSSFYKITSFSTEYYYRLIQSGLLLSSRILEYGCGVGVSDNLYKKINCDFYGIDISNEAVLKSQKQANLNGLKVIYSVQDAEATSFNSSFFDVIFGSGILHHLNLEKSLKELSRISKPMGSCVFVEPLGHNPIINIFRALTPNMRTLDEHPLLESDLKIMSHYFESVNVRYFYLLTLFSVFFRKSFVFNPVYKILFQIDELLIKLFPRLAKYCWICVIHLKTPIK
jgi:SAM-dependent methyltransferase